MSQIVIDTIDSHVLQNNPLGDSPCRRLPIYLPSGYDDSTERYPVVYLLAGFAGRGSLMLNDFVFDETIQERADRLIQAGTIQPMILVLPDGFTRYGGSQYLNSSAIGRYEDHLIEEIVPFVDQHYRTKTEPSFRAIAGKSSGGYGALVLTMKHPDLFGLVACHSGDMYFEYGYKPDFVKFLNATGKLGLTTPEKLAEFMDNFSPKMFPKPSSFFDVIHTAAMSACYSPNPDSVCGFDLPVDQYTGELKAEVWARWLKYDPLTMLESPAHVETLKQAKLVFLDCGNRDEYALQYGARIMAQRLEKLGVAHHHEEFNGGHRHTQHRYDVSLKAISEAL